MTFEKLASSHVRSVDLLSEDAMSARRLYDLVPPASFLNYSYQVILGRSADAEGLQHYEQKLAEGVNRRDVILSLIASSEARRLARNEFQFHSPEDYVAQVYLKILGREPDPQGLVHYAKKAASRRGRLRLARDIASSSEAKLRNSHIDSHRAALRSYAGDAWKFKVPVWGGILQRHSEVMSALARLEDWAAAVDGAGNHSLSSIQAGTFTSPAPPVPKRLEQKAFKDSTPSALDADSLDALQLRKWLIRRVGAAS